MFTNKAHLRETKLMLYCTKIELRYIQACAKKEGLTVPRYLHRLAVQGFINKDKSLPPEVLAFRGQLQHLAGVLHPIARKRLGGDDLNALERAELKQTMAEINNLLLQIKKFLS